MLRYLRDRRRRTAQAREAEHHRRIVISATDTVISRVIRDPIEVEFSKLYPADVQRECLESFGLAIPEDCANEFLIWRLHFRGYNPRYFMRG
ncbi:hypothetical protein QMK19_39375 [Streptomyces sp. H10-C2]|uniref:hypothetical protein n=1 Tax=Streptomyces sp. H10-C2 TaxID=3046210 RepID=UPI0024B8D528|nr:hypothetical protein [Streptomyces sp. H10-C2]MDJ0375491.1 hypothetical protein [Streptomyces sp. H10-C2]